MKKLTWWYRLVGVFYLLLALISLYGTFVNPQVLKSSIPLPVDDAGFKVFLDFNLTLVLGLLILGLFAFWAARRPLQHLSFVWLVVWLEAIRGIADNFYLMVKGYGTLFYALFSILSLLIVATGVMFAF